MVADRRRPAVARTAQAVGHQLIRLARSCASCLCQVVLERRRGDCVGGAQRFHAARRLTVSETGSRRRRSCMPRLKLASTNDGEGGSLPATACPVRCSGAPWPSALRRGARTWWRSGDSDGTSSDLRRSLIAEAMKHPTGRRVCRARRRRRSCRHEHRLISLATLPGLAVGVERPVLVNRSVRTSSARARCTLLAYAPRSWSPDHRA